VNKTNKKLTLCFYKTNFMNIPQELKYTKDHEWVKIEGDVATVGVTDFAQGELGDIVYVEVETLGETLEREEVFGTVEAVKTVSDLFLPLAGEIMEFNDNLENTPEKVNSDPYGEGWMIKLKLSDQSQVSDLLSPEEYEDLIGS
jgi:glycine cleavage system H protein